MTGEAFMSGPSLIDCHLHLQEDCFAADLPAVISRAQDAGVRLFICNGASQSDWPTVLSLARSNRTIIPCFGIHPWYASACAPYWLAELKHFLTAVPSGVGETGLDRYIEPRNEKVQEDVFRAQLTMAAKLGRPITIHCVQAWGWMMDILRTHRPLPDQMLFHSYGGSIELIKPLAAMGGYFSYAGSALREKAVHRRAAIAATPLDRLMLETDAPDMIPPRRFCIASDGKTAEGKPRNEPANLAGIVRGTAELVGMTPDELGAHLVENARRLFGGIIPDGI
jgi:TatD DNase family protein